jgi:cell division protein FtsL
MTRAAGDQAERPKAPRQTGKVVAVLLLTTFFTVAALAHVWVRLQVVRLGYEISRQTDREARLQQLHRKLQVERALLRNPERLERLGRERLRLTMPDPAVIRALDGAERVSTRRPGGGR